jgi:hypothetical protein
VIDSTVVEHSPTNYMIRGFNPAAAWPQEKMQKINDNTVVLHSTTDPEIEGLTPPTT